MPRSKIIFVIDQLGRGGAEKQLYELVKGLNKARFEPMVISLSEGRYWENEIKKIGIMVIELRRKRSFEFGRLLRLKTHLKKQLPEIVHTFLFAGNAYGRIAARLAGVPIIIVSERDLDVWKGWFHVSVDRLLARITDCVISNSEASRDYLVQKRFLSPEKSIVIHNGIDVGLYCGSSDGLTLRETFGMTKADPVIGMVANLIEKKNHIMLLNAVKLISTKLPNVKALLVGDGILWNSLERYAQQLQIRNNIIFAGLRNDVPDLLNLMNVFVLTSTFEGLPNAIMEAMAAGLPCVVTDVGGNRELVVDRETGFLVPLNDTKTMAERILFLLQHPQEAQAMGRKGKNRIEREFGLEKMINATEKVYEKLLQKKGLLESFLV